MVREGHNRPISTLHNNPCQYPSSTGSTLPWRSQIMSGAMWLAVLSTWTQSVRWSPIPHSGFTDRLIVSDRPGCVERPNQLLRRSVGLQERMRRQHRWRLE